MLSPSNRMRRSADFGRAMRGGRRAGREALTVVYLEPPRVAGASPAARTAPRVGFIVSKAVGGAVVRKRVQRRLRHLMRERVADLPAGSLLVVRAKPLAATQGHDTLAAQLDGALASVTRPRKNATRRRRGRGEAPSETLPAGGRNGRPHDA
ncbi:ribonuclease P protein component [Spinactinospora alkalitolerans]|uniref:Ribonuclease P protein component n=1 Tax=Spinactinospora alkalitolerans TaxID=687207 RepID=A0A852U373_9ACTN|nr:ribonuclease P protein component [Spinactinospora alkalitolerans]NYE50678.1 ribonuclease P protein component [Spinactinospora alkalitolerans]